MNLQQVMIKYTRLVAEKLYDIIDLNVEFPYFLTQGFSVSIGVCSYAEDKTIRFNGAFFMVDELEDTAWYLILHEITHIKILSHSKEFWLELKNNFDKTMEIRTKFYEETGLEENYRDMDYFIYFDDDSPPPNLDEVEIDYENLEWEDYFFSLYKMPGGFDDDF